MLRFCVNRPPRVCSKLAAKAEAVLVHLLQAAFDRYEALLVGGGCIQQLPRALGRVDAGRIFGFLVKGGDPGLDKLKVRAQLRRDEHRILQVSAPAAISQRGMTLSAIPGGNDMA